MKEGERVGAVSHGRGNHLALFGYGVYLGEQKPSKHKDRPVGAGADRIKKFDLDCPLIKLDSGEYVWGCECWWGPEATVRKHCDAMVERGGTVETVDIIARRLEAEG